MLSFADSWMPRMFSTASSATMSTAAARQLPAVAGRGTPRPGKTDRYGGTVNAEIAIVTV